MNTATGFIIAITSLVLVPLADAQNPDTPYAQADFQYGARIYISQCTECHGENGDRVAGIDMRTGRFKRVSSDSDLRTAILSVKLQFKCRGHRCLTPN